jgi:deoxyadenosine/deoxycytidine kinase
LFAENIISDFMLEKDPIFASLTLNDDELALYQKIFRSQISQLPLPDLVIYLQASPNQLFQRIKKRGNPMETNISIDYLQKLCFAYNKFFHQFTISPLLIVNTASFNPIENEKDFTAFINQISTLRGQKNFF